MKKEKEKERTYRQTEEKERRERERANSIVSSNSNSSAMPLLTCLSTLIHTYTIIKAACIYQSYSSCQTSRECVYCAPDVTIVFCQWAIYYVLYIYIWSNLIFHFLVICLLSFLLYWITLSLSFPSLSCTWRFILLEIGLLPRSLARL